VLGGGESPAPAWPHPAPSPGCLPTSPGVLNSPPFRCRFIKKLEHTWKALVHDGVSPPSVHRHPARMAHLPGVAAQPSRNSLVTSSKPRVQRKHRQLQEPRRGPCPPRGGWAGILEEGTSTLLEGQLDPECQSIPEMHSVEGFWQHSSVLTPVTTHIFFSHMHF
jgi:hypothetical protein